MQNFIFISPNFPTNYWQFCRELKNNGMNVLGIGDQPYDELKPELKDSLNEYYKVGSLENYDGVLPEGRHRHRTLPHGGRLRGLPEVHRRGGLPGGGKAG